MYYFQKEYRGLSQLVKDPPANSGDIIDVGSFPGPGRSPGGGNGNLCYGPWGRKELDTHRHTKIHMPGRSSGGGSGNLCYGPWGRKELDTHTHDCEA